MYFKKWGVGAPHLCRYGTLGFIVSYTSRCASASGNSSASAGGGRAGEPADISGVDISAVRLLGYISANENSSTHIRQVV